MNKYTKSVEDIVGALKQNPTAELILYGGGLFARELIAELEKINIKPAAICDSDESKHGGEINGIQIMSLKDAKSQFSNPLIYISSDVNLREISYQLQEGKIFDTAKIINYVPMKIRRYCKFIDEQWAVGNNFIIFCCSDFGRNESPKAVFYGDHDRMVDDFLDLRKQITHELDENIPTVCSGCPQLQEILMTASEYYTAVSEYEGLKSLNVVGCGICNFKCIYCEVWPRRVHPDASEIDLPELLKVLKQRNLINREAKAFYTRAEITLDPKRAGMYDCLDKFDDSTIFTNATLYDENITRLLKTGNRRIYVSMDAGTRETFAKIKQNDLYDKVCENLRRYASETNRCDVIILKYVMLSGVNDNQRDIDGFLQLAKEIKAEKVHLSSDFSEKYKIDANAIKMSKYLCKKAEEMGLVCEAVSDVIEREIDIERVY